MATNRKGVETNGLEPLSEEVRVSRFIWQPDDITIVKASEPSQPAAASPPFKSEPKPCGCDCQAMTRGGAFLPGHAARHKGRRLNAARAGDEAACAELRERGWATDETIDEAKAKLSEGKRAERKRAKLQAKAERLRAELAAVEAQLAAFPEQG